MILPNAHLPILEQNPEMISWYHLSYNPAAMHFLELNPEKIDWWCLSTNPAIFVYDYSAMKESKKAIHEELIQKMFHPKNIMKFNDWGFDTEMYEE